MLDTCFLSKVLKQNSIGACFELLPVGVKVELHPWQVASSSRGHTERQTTIRTYIHTCSQSRVNVHVCWRKPEHQQGTCTKNMHHAVTVFSAALHRIMLSLSAQSISHIWIGSWQMLFNFSFTQRARYSLTYWKCEFRVCTFNECVIFFLTRFLWWDRCRDE